MIALIVILAIILTCCFVRDYLDLQAYYEADELTRLDMGEPAMPHRAGIFAVIFWMAALLLAYL